jgi:hypothetical protein
VGARLFDAGIALVRNANEMDEWRQAAREARRALAAR